ncbi:NAD(P)/FAD-dependent oxidoreductase [Streptomyces sp. NPDC006997]|uniref:FAD-dependent oxidoreductase n=1 Tax=Streptomyces sp. NPDC006997 TaxID=3155356 RepID=UPI0033FA432E
MNHADVFIAGAGPVGCATAHAFADQGWRSLMVEVFEQPTPRPTAEMIFPPALELLDRWGVELPPERRVRGTGVTLYEHGGGEPVELRFPPDAQPLVTPYPDLVQAMRDSLMDRMEAEVLYGVQVLNVELDGSVHTTRGKFDTQFRADLLVGADGRWSTVRQRMYGDVPQAVTSHTASLMLEGTGLTGYEQARVITDEHGRCARVHAMGRDLLGIALDLPEERPPDDDVRAYLEKHYVPMLPPELHDPLLRAAGEPERITWSGEGIRLRRTYEYGRISMVGDAVGHQHPLLGIDFTMGVEDAVCLARYGRANGYDRARPEDSAGIEYAARHFFQALTARTPETVGVRRLLWEQLRSGPAAREAAMRLFSVDVRATGLVPVFNVLEEYRERRRAEADVSS